MEYINKYNLSLEQNIYLAKRNIVDYIWKSANLEGIPVTFPETQAIYDGQNVSHLRVDEIVTINNLKHAWQFLLSTIDSDIDFKYVCSINSLVGNSLIESAGNLRIYEVRMSGTNWVPNLPSESNFSSMLDEVNTIAHSTERAITLMCKMMKMQLFNDGNKRTAMLVANHEMIKNGNGIITISNENKTAFGEKLIKYYETDDIEDLRQFIYNHCIDGLVVKD